MNEQQNSSEHHSSGEHSHSSSHKHHHHHKRKIRIPKNAVIIILAVVAFVAVFALLVRYFDQKDAEELGPIDELSLENSAETDASAQETDNAGKASPAAAQKTGVRWCAIGDSITYGIYSLTGPDGSVSASVDDRESIGWPYRVAKTNGWNLTNLSAGNKGYLNPAEDESILPGYALARDTDFTPYNLVTISLGINDWLSNCPMGSMEDDPSAETITAFIPAMRATIEAIAQNNPACKIVVILPLNIKGYDQTYGTKDTNWALNYAQSSTGTLKQFSETMAEVCEMYGIETIDLTTQSFLNSISLPVLLPDGVHPSAEAHELLAHELAAKIAFK